MRLFICTTPEDEPLLESLTDALDGYRMTVDIDRMIGQRDSRPTLQASIQDCEAFVFALTPNTVSHRRCHWEFSQAVHNDRPIVIAQLAPVDPFPRALEDYLFVDMDAPDSTETLLDALYVLGATPPSVLVQLFRNRLLLAIVMVVGLIVAFALAGPYSPYQDDIQRVVVGIVQVADRADVVYNPPVPTPDPTLVAAQRPLQQMTLSASAETLFREGQLLAREGDYLAAIDTFNRTLALSPGAAGVYIAQGGVYLALNAPDTAWGNYTRAVELAPNIALPYTARGEFFLTVGDPQSALNDAQAALDLEPDNGQARILRGRAYAALGEPDAALEDLTAALDRDPQSAAALTYRGDVHRMMGNAKPARTDYDAALAANPLYAPAFTQRGLLLAGQGNPDSALADFNRAIELNASDGTALEARGAILGARGDFTRALADYTRAIRVSSDDPELYLQRGRFYRCDGQPTLAVADFTQAADLNLDAAVTRLSQPVTYTCAGQPTPTLNPARISGTDPNLESAYLYLSAALLGRADTHAEQGDQARLLDDLTLAIRLNPAYTETAALYHRRGGVYEAQGALTNALDDYQTAVDIAPEVARYRLDYGRMLANAGETENALRAFNRAVGLNPSLVDAHLAIGDLYAADERYGLALQTYTRAYYIDRQHIPTLARRVQALAALERCAEATEALALLTDLAPSNNQATAAETTYRAACRTQENPS